MSTIRKHRLMLDPLEVDVAGTYGREVAVAGIGGSEASGRDLSWSAVGGQSSCCPPLATSKAQTSSTDRSKRVEASRSDNWSTERALASGAGICFRVRSHASATAAMGTSSFAAIDANADSTV